MAGMTNKKRAAVLPAKGIGDALLMLIASHHLQTNGYQVTTYHPSLQQLQKWFPNSQFAPAYNQDDLSQYDLVIAENDNSSRIASLLRCFQGEKRNSLSLFYPTYKPGKNAPLAPLDYCFNADLPMTENIAAATANLLQGSALSSETGIIPLTGLIQRKYPKRVLLHPLSSSEKKNWSAKRYVKLSHKLQEKGFEPLFILTSEERKAPFWQEAAKNSPQFDNLSALAAFVYESGFVIGNDSLLGHLGSLLGLATLVLADNPQRMQLWRPGWHPGEVLTPPFWLPNGKLFFRLRTKFWRDFISVKRVLQTFDHLTC